MLGYNGIIKDGQAAIDMAHPFKDQIVVFIGTPGRFTRKEARNELLVVGGVPDERITAFTNYVVAFPGAENTKLYQRALKYSKLLTILTEDQYADILAGKAQPPEKPQSDVVVIPSANAEAEALVSDQFHSDHLNRKRINSMARHGVPTPEGQVKVDMRMLEKMGRVSKALQENDSE